MTEDDPEDFSFEVEAQPAIGEILSKRKEIALKKEKLLRTAEDNLTFQPTLYARPGDIRSKVDPLVSRFDRLYGDAVKRLEVDPKSRSRHDDRELTFKPSISAKARSFSTDRRASDLVNSMHKGIGVGRTPPKESSKNPCLFKPTISKRASSMERTSSVVDTTSRLYASKDAYKQKLDLKKAADDKRNAEVCTFSPIMPAKIRMNTITGSLIQKSPNLADRLNSYAATKKSKLEQEKASQELRSMEGVTFQPKLISKSKNATMSQPVGASTQRGRDAAVKIIAGNRFDHLYKDAVKRKAEDKLTRSKVDEGHMTTVSGKAKTMPTDRKAADPVSSSPGKTTECRKVTSLESPVDDSSYKPVISSRASSLDRSASALIERLYVSGDSERMSKLKCEAAERELEECPFSPDISPSNKGGSPLDSSMSSEKSLNTVERLLKYGEEKKRKLYEEKIARAQINMSDVTFQPKLPKSPPARLECEENIITGGNGNQFDRLYNDAMKRKSSESSIRLELDESYQQISPKVSKSIFEDIGKRSKDSAEKKVEASRTREVLLDTVEAPIASSRANPVDRSSSRLVRERLKMSVEKKREEKTPEKRVAAEKIIEPNLTACHLRSIRSRSPSVESTGRSVSTFSQGSSSLNSAKMAGRLAKDPAGSVVKRRMEEERRLKAEKELAAVKLNFAKAEKEIQVARSRSNSKGNSPAKISPRLTPPTSARRESVQSLRSAEPSKGLMLSPSTSKRSPLKSTTPTKTILDVRPASRAEIPFGRNV